MSTRSIHNSATKSSPRVQRCTSGRSGAPSLAGSKRRTNRAGAGPSTWQIASTDAMTDATRPNASAGGDEGDDLAILERRITPDDLHGISGRVRIVERGIQPVQWVLWVL